MPSADVAPARRDKVARATCNDFRESASHIPAEMCTGDSMDHAIPFPKPLPSLHPRPNSKLRMGKEEM